MIDADEKFMNDIKDLHKKEQAKRVGNRVAGMLIGSIDNIESVLSQIGLDSLFFTEDIEEYVYVTTDICESCGWWFRKDQMEEYDLSYLCAECYADLLIGED